MKTIIGFIFICVAFASYAQRGKDGIITISSNTIVNEYTSLTTNVASGSNSISVANSSLNANGRFSGTLNAGDLLLIIQMQGASIDHSPFNYTWGSITNYNNCGNYEFVEVSGTPNTNTINLRCGLKNSYTAAGHVQVIRVPRYQTLNVNATITSPAWDGTTGGLVCIETLGDLSIGSAGQIDVSGLGFRGGIGEVVSSYYGGGQFGSNDHNEGGAKGESIVGYVNEYNALSIERAQGAPANGGGGGNGHNGGGGGGANGGNIALYQDGLGIPNPIYNTAWALETPSIVGVNSTGGGRGGYTFSSNNQNPMTVAPGNSAWGGDSRKNVGGRGGRPLDYSSGRIFFGGGGGAGDMNNSYNTGGSGGNGGGLVYLRCYGNLTGSGTISGNGSNGVVTTSTSAPFGGYAGEDAAGGGGGGGTIVLDVVGSIGSINCSVQGGLGGNQALVAGSFFFGSLNEAEGTGGGGGGGKILSTSSISGPGLNGGTGGTTNSASMTSFPNNGSTGGGNGDQMIISPNSIEIVALNDTICAGNSTTLTATVSSGTLPSGTSFIWYDAASNGNFIGAGPSFTTGNLSNDTTFYLGVCPGDYTIPVSVIMGASFSYSVAGAQIQDENCGQGDGNITGITITGGVQPLQYEWNNSLTTDQDLTGASAGNYTLVITDGNGCSSTIGNFVINENTGPTIDATNMAVQDDHCGQGLGSIQGVVATGQGTLSYSWNSGFAASQNLSGLSAGNYDLEVTDGFGCTESFSGVTVANISGPAINSVALAITSETCNNQNGSISGITVSGEAPFSYTWNGSSSTNIDITNLDAGTYNLVVTDAFGCTSSLNNLLVDEIGFPTAYFTMSSSSILEGDTVFFLDSSYSNIISTTFTLANGSQISDTMAFEIFPERGVYEICLLVENASGCRDSICQSIVVNPSQETIVIPNVFTPNGDNDNQYFSVKGIDRNYGLLVYNRWGTLVFSESPYMNLWEGISNSGKYLSEGTYFYILQPIDDTTERLETFKGTVTIIR